MIATGLVGAGLGAYSTLQGAKEQSDAKNALANYQRQTLVNPYDNMQVSTRSADLQREEQARLASSQVDASSQAGTRGIVGNLGRIESGNQLVNEKIGADLNKQEADIAEAQAQDQAKIRQMIEMRQNGDIAGYSSQFNAGKNDKNMGLGIGLQGLGMVANNYKAPATTTTTQPTNMNYSILNSNNYPFGQVQGAPNYYNK